jgi:hypothetical protein
MMLDHRTQQPVELRVGRQQVLELVQADDGQIAASCGGRGASSRRRDRAEPVDARRRAAVEAAVYRQGRALASRA